MAKLQFLGRTLCRGPTKTFLWTKWCLLEKHKHTKTNIKKKTNNKIRYLTRSRDPGVVRVMPPGGIASSLDWHRLVAGSWSQWSAPNFPLRIWITIFTEKYVRQTALCLMERTNNQTKNFLYAKRYRPAGREELVTVVSTKLSAQNFDHGFSRKNM